MATTTSANNYKWLAAAAGVLILLVLFYYRNPSPESKVQPLAIPTPENVAGKQPSDLQKLPTESAPSQSTTDTSTIGQTPTKRPPVIPTTVKLADSDQSFRQALHELSAYLTNLLATDELIKRIILLTNDISQNQLPSKNRMFLRMPQKIPVEKNGEDLFISDASYQRYNFIADAVAAIDISQALVVYQRFRPLFQQVYSTLSYPANYRLEDIFIKAATAIIQAPKIDTKIKVIPKFTVYQFADQKLEELSPVAKQMLRMGPSNSAKIQAKMQQFVAALTQIYE